MVVLCFISFRKIDVVLICKYQVQKKEVLAAWNGIRPLVKDCNSKDTKSIPRHHAIVVSNSKLITITGGKYTTFRSMAQATIDKALQGTPTMISLVLK